MIEANTRQRLVRVIIEHYLGPNQGVGKFNIEIASTRAGISRQAFNRYYGDLKSYVLGRSPAAQLIEDSESDRNAFKPMLIESQSKICELQSEVRRLQVERENYVKVVEHNYLTTLMNSDLALHNSVELGNTVEKQALHNEKLIRENQDLKVELSLAKANAARCKTIGANEQAELLNVVIIDPDLSLLFRKFFKDADLDDLEEGKFNIIEKNFKKVIMASRSKFDSVVIFVERYMCGFEKYSRKLLEQGLKNSVLIRVPLHSPDEIRSLLKSIAIEMRVELHVPMCISAAVLNGQRKFLFQDTPELEFISADKMRMPSVNTEFSKVVFYRVEQGE
jgi:hypothetical protein